MQNLLDMILPKLLEQLKADNIQHVVVAAVITKSPYTKILCLKCATDKSTERYELPFAKVDNDEPMLTVLERAIKAITQLVEFEIIDYLSFFDFRSSSDEPSRQINFIVQCHNPNSLKLNSSLHEGYAWLAAHEINHYSFTEEIKLTLMAYFLRQGLVISPSYDFTEAWQLGIEYFVASGIISQNEKVLLLKRPCDNFQGGIYELPGGIIEHGDCVETALMRKIKALTNLEVKAICSTLPYFDFRSATGSTIRQFTYEIHVHDTNCIKLCSVYEGFAWIHAVELNAYPLSKEIKWVVGNYLSSDHE